MTPGLSFLVGDGETIHPISFPNARSLPQKLSTRGPRGHALTPHLLSRRGHTHTWAHAHAHTGAQHCYQPRQIGDLEDGQIRPATIRAMARVRLLGQAPCHWGGLLARGADFWLRGSAPAPPTPGSARSLHHSARWLHHSSRSPVQSRQVGTRDPRTLRRKIRLSADGRRGTRLIGPGQGPLWHRVPNPGRLGRGALGRGCKQAALRAQGQRRQSAGRQRAGARRRPGDSALEPPRLAPEGTPALKRPPRPTVP